MGDPSRESDGHDPDILHDRFDPCRILVSVVVDGLHRLPRQLAEWNASMLLTQLTLIVALSIFYVVLGCFFDGI